jgi:hypothetical protein
MPEGTVYVGRPSPWGNPYSVGTPFPRRATLADPSLVGLIMNEYDVVELYRGWLGRRLEEDADYLTPLRGRSLSCWCAPGGHEAVCHADVLLELANAPAVPA